MYNIKTDGLLYHFLNRYSGGTYRRQDLCSVVRGIFRGILYAWGLIGAISLALTILFYWLIPFSIGGIQLVYADGFADLSFNMFMGILVMMPIAGICMCLIIVTLEFIGKSYKNITHTISDKTEGSFIGTWYDGFKNKYCPRVSYVDPEESD